MIWKYSIWNESVTTCATQNNIFKTLVHVHCPCSCSCSRQMSHTKKTYVQLKGSLKKYCLFWYNVSITGGGVKPNLIKNKTKYFRLWQSDSMMKSDCSLAIWVLYKCSLSALWSYPEVILKLLMSSWSYLEVCLKIWTKKMKIECSRQTCAKQTDRQTKCFTDLLF